MVAPTRSSSDSAGAANPRAWFSVLLGLASTATMPLAIVLTRYSEGYELLHSALAIPLGLVLGIGAILAARGARTLHERTLGRVGGVGLARLGFALGVLGVCLATASAIAVGVYALLDYLGERD